MGVILDFNLAEFLSQMFIIITPENLFLCFIGAFIGTVIGVLPGIGPLGAMSILIPVTFKITPVGSVIMLAGVYYGSQYGGSTTSILVNIPGESSSVVTCLDGYQMALKGEAGPGAWYRCMCIIDWWHSKYIRHPHCR